MNVATPDQKVRLERLQRATRVFPRHAQVYAQTRLPRALKGMLQELEVLTAADRAGQLWAGWMPPGRHRLYLPSRASWLATRQVLKTLGGSDAGPILFDDFEGEWGVWAPEFKQPHSWTEAGLRWEQFILDLYFDRPGAPEPLVPEPDLPAETDWSFKDEHLLAVGPEPWLHASPDHEAVDEDLGPGGVDAKLIHRARGEDDRSKWAGAGKAWETGEIIVVEERAGLPLEALPLPPVYDVQARIYMAVLDVGWWDIAAMMPHHDLRVYRVLRDLDAEELMLDGLYTWWERHVAEGEPPELRLDDSKAGGLCAKWLAARLDRRARGAREATDAEMTHVNAYLQAREAESKAKKQKARARAQLLAALASTEHTELTFGGGAVARWNGATLRVSEP